MAWVGEDLVKADLRDPVDSQILLNASLTFKKIYRGVDGFDLQFSGYNLLDADYRSPNPSGMLQDDLPREGVNFIGKITCSF